MWCDIGWMNELSTVILRVCDNLDDDVLKSMNWCHQFVFIFSNFSQAHISSSTSSSSSSSNSLYLLHDHENDEMNDNMNVPMMMMKAARRRRRWGVPWTGNSTKKWKNLGVLLKILRFENDIILCNFDGILSTYTSIFISNHLKIISLKMFIFGCMKVKTTRRKKWMRNVWVLWEVLTINWAHYDPIPVP